ncbi:gliding motility-associated C-terminal domain-containing protein [Flavobacterium sp. N3904]|uniref:gliding motility-associated C-terminal domain-containing protein n=1 Tax=Flavobacterium sp. N3904 TaxID=2986835 RepID=UPI0022240982|nr:gliding motility-associated C-terminal domain-containing protein [Flavobacterium sp. N3904]
MVSKLFFPIKIRTYTFFYALSLLFCCNIINAQCGGTDNALTVCDIANPLSKTVDLNPLLGTYTAGGTWNDDDKSGGLNKNSGILNAQQIKKSGTYHYTYTVLGVSGCIDNNAVITVTIGGYTGVPAPNASICSSETAFNLFQVFDGNSLAPQIGGVWHDDDNSGGLSNNILNASVPVADDTYSYTYTIDAIGSCPAPPPSTIFVSIYRSPEAGTSTNLLICSDQLSSYTNFDLNTKLSGADSGGTWTESGTSEISDDTDSTIDIQNIYNTKGAGTYRFTYTVASNNTVCINQSSSVDIIIKKQLDFTGTTLAVYSDICENEIATARYIAVLTQSNQVIPDGIYVITYAISGVSIPLIAVRSFTNGTSSFPIPSSNFQQVKNYTISILNITENLSFGICTNTIGTIEDVLHIFPIPKIDNATLTIAPVCQTFGALVEFSGISNLADGNYDITYNINGSNTATAIPAVLTITGGLGSFTIPKTLISNIGVNSIIITKITNTITGCSNVSTLTKFFTVNPLPDITKMVVGINDVCQGLPTNVNLSGLGTLTSISIDYTISGVNTVASQTIPLAVTAGRTSFFIPASNIPNVGVTTFTITNVTNTLTGCSVATLNNKNFTVNAIPVTPIATDQKFCSSDNATVADLIPQGNQYQWFDSLPSTVPLLNSTSLVSGNYYVKEVNTLTGCESGLKMIDVIINTTPQINSATLKIDPICQTFGALVEFSGTSNLTDGNYDILYNLTGSNTGTAIPAVLSVTGGLGSFSIPSALIPNPGLNSITITKITNSITGCTNSSTLSKSFTVNPLPNITNLAVAINDVCQGFPTNVNLTGLGTLTSITIDYTISGVNTVGSQDIPLTVVAGGTSFVIPATDIPNVGLTTFTITNVTNALTGCSISTINNKSFTVNTIPATPLASDQKFCSSDNATVADLIPQGNQYEWFDSLASTVPLLNSTPLVSGNYYVKEVNTLTGCESSLKSIVVQINTTPQINNATLTIAPICQGFNAVVNFSGTSNLADGNYNILYNLSGSNVATAVPATLTVTSGLASFTIAANLIENAGNTTIAIINITNTSTNCTNTSTLSKVFVVNALPDISNMVVTIKDGCLGQPINVQLSGLGTLTNITLTYSVSGSNTISSQIIPLVVSNGNTSFLIPASNLGNIGMNTLVITDLTNTGNSCSTTITSVSKNFSINPIPSNPTANNQEFCETDLATVANLLPNGNQYKWFDSATSNTPLSSGTLLVSADYFVKEINLTTGCESGATQISVVINVVQAPVLKPNGQEFCGADKPTIQSLSNNTNSNGNLVWYNAASNGTLLANTDLLIEGATYYGFDFNTITNCYSNPLPVTVSLTDCTATPDNFIIPSGFSPNDDGVNDTFQIVNIEFLYPNYTLEIFNRYGNVLFKGNISKPAWDGKNSNSNFIDGNAPSGVYFYIINYNKDKLRPKQGSLYLNR